jgi:cysteine desulfurase / selenocysteine lyase
VTFTAEGYDPAEIRTRLLARKINVSVTTTFGTRLDMEGRGITSMIRSSVHYYNTTDELERLVHEIAELAAGR